jgi:alkane 1-monooxygenase
MNALGSLAYALGLIPGALAVAGNLRGGPWALGATAFLGALCVADWFVRDSRRDPPARGDFTPDLILALHVLVNAAAVGTLLYGVASGRLPRWRVGDATLSTGLNSGVSGIVVAHELIHRRARAWRAVGVGNLLLVNYAHFYIEHVKGHHRLVGTRRDSSTARPGESIYHFLLRSLPGQFVGALRIEADRLARRGRGRFGPANFVVATTAVQALIAVAIGLGLGPRALTAYLAQGAIAVLLLQAVNYLQHSGLERPEGSRVSPVHSWQSDRVSGRFLLLELPRHADHHGHAAKPYHALVSHDDSPTLPLGLLGTLPVLLIPPLWFALARRSRGVGVRSQAAGRRPPATRAESRDRADPATAAPPRPKTASGGQAGREPAEGSGRPSGPGRPICP